MFSELKITVIDTIQNETQREKETPQKTTEQCE